MLMFQLYSMCALSNLSWQHTCGIWFVGYKIAHIWGAICTEKILVCDQCITLKHEPTVEKNIPTDVRISHFLTYYFISLFSTILKTEIKSNSLTCKFWKINSSQLAIATLNIHMDITLYLEMKKTRVYLILIILRNTKHAIYILYLVRYIGFNWVMSII